MAKSTKPRAKSADKPRKSQTFKRVNSTQTDHAILQALRIEVKEQLRRCTPDVYPAITARLHDVGGYNQVEEAVIGVVLRQHITPSAAVGLLESEWGSI